MGGTSSWSDAQAQATVSGLGLAPDPSCSKYCPYASAELPATSTRRQRFHAPTAALSPLSRSVVTLRGTVPVATAMKKGFRSLLGRCRPAAPPADDQDSGSDTPDVPMKLRPSVNGSSRSSGQKSSHAKSVHLKPKPKVPVVDIDTDFVKVDRASVLGLVKIRIEEAELAVKGNYNVTLSMGLQARLSSFLCIQSACTLRVPSEQPPLELAPSIRSGMHTALHHIQGRQP